MQIDQGSILQQTQSNSEKEQSIIQTLLEQQNEQDHIQIQQSIQHPTLIQQDDIQNLKIRYSNQSKHLWIKLNQTRTEAKNVLQDLAFALCEPSIPNNSIVQFTFKTGEFAGVIIGICEQKNFNCCTISPQDAYLLNDNGQASLNFDEDDESEQIKSEFEWGCNEIINVQVDTKIGKMKWIKVRTQESYIVDIDPTKCYFPFVGLNMQSSIQILDQT
ncbi:unnamed protein product (macronuclear) [Paramecium tetraurelia]|uniref:SPRY domain-containing protein n=1 Tax=Paramecium tetraurelia TaxID=5888 RepID=A0EFH6_PARTE|nr:uncharacterized protein GSPATT00026390001 [Paramecium tetraurelia]CAK94067.1 unnamed protein product [Paramecium tetraurelia]|eukprot:XP_001461440.1 hypothetical protein (macronuclear) [Paramecium tetraurelia strain d4-2]